LLRIIIDLNKKLYFFTDRKKTIYLAKGLSRHVFMNTKLKQAYAIDKKPSHSLEL
jgi:hypothetical protein